MISGANASDMCVRYERVWKPEGAASATHESGGTLDGTSGRVTPDIVSFSTDKAGLWLDLCNAARVRYVEVLPMRWADTNSCMDDLTPSNLNLMDIYDLEWHTSWLQMILSCALFPSLFATMSVGGRALGKRALERAEHSLLRLIFSLWDSGVCSLMLQAADEYPPAAVSSMSSDTSDQNPFLF